MPTCYDPSATAITTVSYVNKAGDPNDGQIIDADIELNAVNNHFFNKDVDPTPTDRNPADLWNTLTHEMGHMQGLDHTCRGASEPANSCTVDNTGASAVLDRGGADGVKPGLPGDLPDDDVRRRQPR